MNLSGPPPLPPPGVSWFIPAENLKLEARKENRPEESSAAWFEAYSRVGPWREPLRQRQVHEHRSRNSSQHRSEPDPDPDPGHKALSSGLVRVSLQVSLFSLSSTFISAVSASWSSDILLISFILSYLGHLLLFPCRRRWKCVVQSSSRGPGRGCGVWRSRWRRGSCRPSSAERQTWCYGRQEKRGCPSLQVQAANCWMSS